jgi:hypothetical protein
MILAIAGLFLFGIFLLGLRAHDPQAVRFFRLVADELPGDPDPEVELPYSLSEVVEWYQDWANS